MADNNIIIIETDPEQMIAKNGCRNIKQFDIQTGCDNLIASLWQDGKRELVLDKTTLRFWGYTEYGYIEIK